MSFTVTCNICEARVELEDGFLKSEKIQVYDSGEFVVSIKCSDCGNEIVSNDV